MPSSLFPEVTAGGSSGAEAAAIRAEASASQAAVAAASASGYVSAASAAADGAQAQAEIADDRATDAGNSASAADLSAEAASDSETATLAARVAAEAAQADAIVQAERALRFAVNPYGEVFSDGDDGYLSAFHYSKQAELNAASAVYIPRDTTTGPEVSALKIIPGTADLFGIIGATNSSGTLAVEVPPTLWDRPAGDREAWFQVRREGAGDVQVTAPSSTAYATPLGLSTAVGRFPTDPGKTAGTVSGTIRKFAGTDRRLYLACSMIHDTQNLSRNLVPVLSSGETLNLELDDVWNGGNSGTNLVVYSCDLPDSGVDEDVTVTLNNDDTMQAWVVNAVTVGNWSGDDTGVGSGSSTAATTHSQTLTPSQNKSLVLFFTYLTGGDGNPGTVNRGNLMATGNSGGTRGVKDLSWIVAYEQLETAASTTYTGTFLQSDGSSGFAVAINPTSTAAGTVRAPGGRTKINEQWGVVTVRLDGTGNIYLEGDLKS